MGRGVQLGIAIALGKEVRVASRTQVGFSDWAWRSPALIGLSLATGVADNHPLSRRKQMYSIMALSNRTVDGSIPVRQSILITNQEDLFRFSTSIQYGKFQLALSKSGVTDQ